MTDTTVAEEKKPLTVPIDDENDAEDSDDGAPEIAATDGQSHLSHSHCHPNDTVMWKTQIGNVYCTPVIVFMRRR